MIVMPTIEVNVETEIAAAPADIAAVMFDAAREPEWLSTVKSVEVIDPALQPGARVRHTSNVMGREIIWTSVVETVHFPHVLALRVDEGRVSGMLAFNIQRSGGGSRVRIQTRGENADLSFKTPAMNEGPIRSGLPNDLDKLKTIVEQK